MSLKLNRASVEVTAHTKHIDFTYNEESYCVSLYWNNETGYDLEWDSCVGKKPEWATNYANETGEELEYALDVLTNLEIGL